MQDWVDRAGFVGCGSLFLPLWVSGCCRVVGCLYLGHFDNLPAPGIGSLLASLHSRSQGHFFLTRRQANRAGSISPVRTKGTVAHISAGVSALALHDPSLLSCLCSSLRLSFHSVHPSSWSCRGTDGEHSRALCIAACSHMGIPFPVADPCPQHFPLFILNLPTVPLLGSRGLGCEPLVLKCQARLGSSES